MQPIEIFGTSYVSYSLGNFIQKDHPLSLCLSSRIGALWEIKLYIEGTKRGKVAGYQLHPFIHDRKAKHLRALKSQDKKAYKILKKIYTDISYD